MVWLGCDVVGGGEVAIDESSGGAGGGIREGNEFEGGKSEVIIFYLNK